MLTLYGTETLHRLSWTVSLAKSCYLTPLILQIICQNSSLQAVLLIHLWSFRSPLKTYLFKLSYWYTSHLSDYLSKLLFMLSYWYTSHPSDHLSKPISSSCPTDIPLIIQIISENPSLQAVILIHLSSFRSPLRTHLFKLSYWYTFHPSDHLSKLISQFKLSYWYTFHPSDHLSKLISQFELSYWNTSHPSDHLSRLHIGIEKVIAAGWRREGGCCRLV